MRSCRRSLRRCSRPGSGTTRSGNTRNRGRRHPRNGVPGSAFSRIPLGLGEGDAGSDHKFTLSERSTMLTQLPYARVVVAAVAAMAIAGGAYAFTASNTVPNTVAGAGSGTVSGYTVTNLHYGLDTTTPMNIDSLTFTVSPVIPSTSSGKVNV